MTTSCQSQKSNMQEIVSYIESELHLGQDGYAGTYEVSDSELEVFVPVDGCRLFWALFTHVRSYDTVSLVEFTVDPSGAKDTDLKMYGRFSSEETSSVRQTPRPLAEYVDVARSYHKFSESEFTPENSLYQCGDINKAIRKGLYFEYGESFQLATGAIFDPHTNQGQGHMFIVIPAKHISDREHTVFLDGAALQFAEDAYNWPQCLGPEKDIDRVHVVGPTHKHRPFYARRGERIDTETAYDS